jgi:hypothetical protein
MTEHGLRNQALFDFRDQKSIASVMERRFRFEANHLSKLLHAEMSEFSRDVVPHALSRGGENKPSTPL